uniref:Uncharacterized protein n=1 Tax=Panagrolaimus superbus TaxID=310955 RepID=A0A914Z5R7_9BILA
MVVASLSGILILLILSLLENVKSNDESNSTDISTTTTDITLESSTQIRAKRQWGGGCGFGGCGGNGFPNCGANGCSSGCTGAGCGRGYGGYGGYGGGGCGCCAGGCGQMCCQNRMPTCSRSCVRGGGCYCDYDYAGGWGRKKRHAMDFDRNNSTEFFEI